MDETPSLPGFAAVYPFGGLSTLFGDYRASEFREMFISRGRVERPQHENSMKGLINEQKRNASPANGLGQA